jgi:hypothetical protein
LANAETERAGIEYVVKLERDAGRQPEDVHVRGFPFDVSSPPRKIEVKAFGGSARGAAIPLEDRQVKAAREDPENFYVYVVDNIAAGDQAKIAVRCYTAKRSRRCSIGPHLISHTGRRSAHRITTSCPRESENHRYRGDARRCDPGPPGLRKTPSD